MRLFAGAAMSVLITIALLVHSCPTWQHWPAFANLCGATGTVVLAWSAFQVLNLQGDNAQIDAAMKELQLAADGSKPVENKQEPTLRVLREMRAAAEKSFRRMRR